MIGLLSLGNVSHAEHVTPVSSQTDERFKPRSSHSDPGNLLADHIFGDQKHRSYLVARFRILKSCANSLPILGFTVVPLAYFHGLPPGSRRFRLLAVRLDQHSRKAIDLFKIHLEPLCALASEHDRRGNVPIRLARDGHRQALIQVQDASLPTLEGTPPELAR